jgi:hypothetical protein
MEKSTVNLTFGVWAQLGEANERAEHEASDAGAKE